MAHYLVRAKAVEDLDPLRAQLEGGEIVKMRPFGQALDFSLRNARLEGDGWATWEENDYCTLPSRWSGPRYSTIISPTCG